MEHPFAFIMKSGLILSLGLLASTTVVPADWLQFRGPNGSGYVEADLPVKPEISWTRELPGKGLSSPIVVGHRVLITVASGANQDRLHVFCFRAGDGEKLWERQFWSTGRTICHEKTSVAAPTPVSDGERVLALFSSNDLFCLDLQGNLLWLRGLTNDYPNASNSLGLASSPILAGGVLIVQIENDSESFSAGIDLKNGKNLWKNPRTKRANWSSPVAIRGRDGSELAALQGSDGVDVVDPATGEVVWRYAQSASTIPSCAPGADGKLYIPSHGLTAVRAGDDGKAEQLWRTGSMRPGTPSPLVHADRIYVITNASVLTCGDATTGDRLWRMRLEGPFGSSPIATDSHLYACNELGLVQVVRLAEEGGEVVGKLELGEMIQCTPAVAHGAIFVRSNGHLWKLSS